MQHKDLLFTGINQIWKVVAGPLLLLLIPYYLSPAEQGFWYTFISIAALSVFADLGFSTIVLQFAAHEFSRLKFLADGRVAGDEQALWRLASFFRFSVVWLLRVVAVVFPLIFAGGYYFLSLREVDFAWQIPWLIYSLASAGVFAFTTLFCFFEGCNSVGRVQSMRVLVSMGTTLTQIIGLLCHWSLMALAFSLVVSLTVGWGLLLYHYRVAMRQLWQMSKGQIYDWWPEFSSLLWRYAISWSSGYFIFQLFTPLAFHFYGPEFAGQVGISIAMWTAGMNISMTWITAMIPQLNIMVEEKLWQNFDDSFNKCMKRSVLTMVAGGSGFLTVYWWLQPTVEFFQHVLPLLSMGILFVCWSTQVYINCLAAYIRAHKEEPLAGISLVSAVSVVLFTVLSAMFLPCEYFVCGFLVTYLWSTPVIYRIFRSYRLRHCRL